MHRALSYAWSVKHVVVYFNVIFCLLFVFVVFFFGGGGEVHLVE